MKTKQLLLLLTLTLLTASQILGQQSDRDWWNSLPPAWKTIFQQQELKGKDIEPTDEMLGRIVKIKFISASGNEGITSLKPLAKLELLETVRVDNCSNLTSLSGIENLKNIKDLDCSNNDNINSLIPLRGLNSLETLNCGNTMVKDLQPLRNLRNLKTLDVHFTTVSELIFLGNLTNLEVLDVSDNQSLFKLDGVEKLINLVNLNCSKTQIRTLDPVSTLKDLSFLDISDTPVNGLRPLASVNIRQNLRELNCNNTEIDGSQLDYLSNHVALEMLRCRNNNICPADAEAFVESFKRANPNCIVKIQASKDEMYLQNNCD